jgi:putative protein kinase ArgK-like GTPase of G3E family
MCRSRHINLPGEKCDVEGEGTDAMKLEIASFQAVAANLVAEGEVCDLANETPSTQTETDPGIAPLIPELGARSIEEIDRLMAKVQDARDYLQSEGERIEQETVRYANLTQLASVTAKIVLDAISQWHPARDQQQSNAAEVTATSPEDSIGAFSKAPDEAP